MKRDTFFRALSETDDKYVKSAMKRFSVGSGSESAQNIGQVFYVVISAAALIAVILGIWIPSVLFRDKPVEPADSGTETVSKMNINTTAETDPETGTDAAEEKTLSISDDGGTNDQSVQRRIYLTTYNNKDVELILKVLPDDNGIKYSGAMAPSKIRFGMAVNGSVKVEPQAAEYEIITVKDESGDAEDFYIAFTLGSKTSIYTLNGTLKGEYLGFRRLITASPSKVYYIFYSYKDNDPIDSYYGLLDSKMNVVIPPEYFEIDYVGYGVIKADRLTFCLEKKTDGKYEKYAGFIDKNGDFTCEGPYEELKILKSALKVKEFGKDAYYIADNGILKKAD